MSESDEDIQHLNILDGFYYREKLTINLGKTKAIIFHTSLPTHKQVFFTPSRGQVLVNFYAYQGVTFITINGFYSMVHSTKDHPLT